MCGISRIRCFGMFYRGLVRGLQGGVVKRDVDDSGNTASDISSLRSSMEIMMENVNHLVTKQQVGTTVVFLTYSTCKLA